jgi:peptidoglycan hydrolase-like protein with peptidoglycan-binding domain
MPDGIYGSETYDAIRKYQTRKHLKNDGVAGKETILAMDLDLVAASKLPPIVLPKPPVVSDPEYQLGISDPLRRHDPGAGAWNSKPKEASYIALKAAIIDALPLAYGVIGDDAVKHMFHYLFNTGLGYTIDLEGMVREVPSAKIRYEDEVVQAKMFVEKLPPDRYEITSKDGELGYNTQHENKNWYFAIGGYTSWGKGVVVVSRQAL